MTPAFSAPLQNEVLQYKLLQLAVVANYLGSHAQEFSNAQCSESHDPTKMKVFKTVSSFSISSKCVTIMKCKATDWQSTSPCIQL